MVFLYCFAWYRNGDCHDDGDDDDDDDGDVEQKDIVELTLILDRREWGS